MADESTEKKVNASATSADGVAATSDGAAGSAQDAAAAPGAPAAPGDAQAAAAGASVPGGAASASAPESAPASESPAAPTAEAAAGGAPLGGPSAPDAAGLADHALESEILAGLTVTAPAPLVVSDEVRRILRIEVPVIVKLAEKRLPLGEIIDLCPGSIVEFAKSADTPLDLLVNNKPIGRGLAVKVGEKFGLRIDEILPVEETIRSLGV